MSCRICGASATRTVLDLGVSPPANSLLDRPDESQNCFPLVLEHCPHCANLQLRDCLDATELYRNYLYVTPDSRALQEHYEQLHHYLTARGYLAPQAFVLEVGSNVGLLLQYLQRKGFKVLGIDAAANICRMARDAGVNTICEFLGVTSARAIRDTYGMPDLRFAANAAGIRRSLRTLITELTSRGHDIYTYGATAKGNTLLNYVGLTREDIRYCVDSTTIKQGKYLPQSRIEVISEESAYASAPDYFLLTAWNYKEEIIAKVRQAGNRRSRFILPIPSVHIV